MQQQQQAEKKVNTLNLAAVVIRGWAATIYLFLRKDLGKNHPGIAGLFGLGWVLLWVAYTHAEGLVWLIPLYVLGLAMNGIGHARKPRDIHTQYGGDPILTMKLLRIKDEGVAKRIGEPFISLVFGMVLIACGYDEGKYFAFGAAAMFMNQGMIDQHERRRIDAMRDAMIEGQYYGTHLRRRK